MSEEVKSFTVSEINRLIKVTLQEVDSLKNIWMRGEVSNFSQTASSGHMYFSVKDNASVMKCAFFSYQSKNHKGKPIKNGMEINVFGSISVYEPGGYYSFSVQKVEEIGQGDILLQIEKLRMSLQAKGIFDIAHKKPLPKFPKRLGIATSPKGAAVEDIIRIATDLNPAIQILVSPCVVQGEDAPNSIRLAIEALNDPTWEVDVIIAGRGGGSFEDLIAFNSEVVVMAFYNSRIPIVSSVGHETDRLLCDYSADATAPTPTAAAKLAIPNVADMLIRIDEMDERIKKSFSNLTKVNRQKYSGIVTRNIFQNPYSMLETRTISVDEIMGRISLLGKNFLIQKRSDFSKTDRLKDQIDQQIRRKIQEFDLTSSRVESFSPLGTLRRGYSVLRNVKKEVISSITQVNLNERAELIVSDGRLTVEIIGKMKE